MKKVFLCLSLLAGALSVHGQMERDFMNPPAEFCNHLILGWDGKIDQQVIESDLDAIQAKGFRNVIIEPGYRMGAPYLSEQWFLNVRAMADAVAKRGMKMWIIDEGKYPSGMAGGKFSKERPDLCMQALVMENGQVKAVRRSSQTRCVNDSTGGKNTKNSLCDYLDTVAVQQFIDWTHNQYKKYLGKHLGTTVLGFRGDEPAYQRVPWTTNMTALFQQAKGYDLTPYLPELLDNERTSLHAPSGKTSAVKADYWDVWSRLFADNFFKKQADWCAENGVRHITHMDKDDDLPWCVKMEGDPFRALSRVQVPGIDVIWSQIYYGSTTEFPRLAASTAHVYGRQRAFSESFAAYNKPLNMASVKYILDYQMARGINFFEFMFWMSKDEPRGYMADSGMKALNTYANRAVWLLSQGQPAARIALYVPIPALWLGDNQPYAIMKGVAHLLTQHQYDYDFITDDGLTEATTVGNGVLRNRSGQCYNTLLVPATPMLTKAAWEKIAVFEHRGGRVIFCGGMPKQCYERTMTQPEAIQQPAWGALIADTLWHDSLQTILPKRQLTLVNARNDSLCYTARKVGDNMVYFLLNQSGATAQMDIDFDCMGTVEQWNAQTGAMTSLDYKVVDNQTRVALFFQPYESKLIVIRKRTVEYPITNYSSIQKAIDAAHNDGGGTVVITAGTHPTGALFFPRGVDLRLEEGSVLESIVDTALYPLVRTRWEGKMQQARAALLTFSHNENCRVWGKGRIDAKGLEWRKIPFDSYGKPKTICFDQCHGGSLRDVTIRNQAFWCLHVLFTRGFSIEDVNIDIDDYVPSSDGIDIDSSTDIIIRNCHLKAHDDCISIKSGKDTDGRRVNQASENILIEHCHFDYGHGGVAMGSEVSGNIRNVTVSHCDMAGENWNPIRFKSQPSRGGIVEHITFSDITIANARNIFEINMTWRMKGATEPPYYPLTQLRDIHFRNIRGQAENAGHLIGFAEQPFTRDVFHFENCRIEVENPLDIQYADVDISGLEQVVKTKK